MVLLSLVFLEKQYSCEVFQTLLTIPNFSKVAVKKIKAEAVVGSCSVKKILEIFTRKITGKFPGKHLYQSILFNKVAAVIPPMAASVKVCNFIKIRLRRGSFFYELSTNFRNIFLQNTSARLYLTFRKMVVWACYFVKWT